jgi:5-methylthioadenosine/S-adenosylhomocysteine deaminase
MKAPKKVDLLLSGCDVVTIDGKNTVIRDGAVAIKGNKIAWIGKASAAKRSVVATSTIDGSDQIAMPGLIDAHVHTAQTLLRGKIAEIDGRRPVKIPVWWNYYVPFESMLTDDDVYLSGLLCYANMISVGTTCFAEAGGPHPDAMARAAIDTGIRGFVSLNTIDQGEHWPRTMITTTKKALDGNVGLVKRWKGTKGGTDRVQAWLSLRQIMTCTPALIEARARRRGRSTSRSTRISAKACTRSTMRSPSSASGRRSISIRWGRSTATCIAPTRSCSRKTRWISM